MRNVDSTAKCRSASIPKISNVVTFGHPKGSRFTLGNTRIWSEISSVSEMKLFVTSG